MAFQTTRLPEPLARSWARLGEAGETEDGVQLDPARRNADLPVQEVEQGNARHASARADPCGAAGVVHLSAPVSGRALGADGDGGRGRGARARRLSLA